MSEDEGDHWRLVTVPQATLRAWFTWDGVKGFTEPFNAGYPTRPGQNLMNWYGPIGMAQILSQNLVSDSAGNLYLVWVDAGDNNVYLSVSRDRAATWSPEKLIAAPGVVQATMPAIAVRAPGHVAVAYWGTTNSDMTRSQWDGYVAESTDVLSPDPTFRSAVVQTTPGVHTLPNGVGEPIEEAGVDFAPDGSVWTGFVEDTCRQVLPLYNCDATFEYTSTRYHGLVAHLVR